MPIPFTCPHCQRTGNAPDALAGKAAKCPACEGPIVIGATPEPVEAPLIPPEWHVTPPPPPPIPVPSHQAPTSSSPPLQVSPLKRARRNSKGGLLQSVDSMLDLHLRRYATPYLLRLYWWLTLFIAFLVMLTYGMTMLSGDSFAGEMTGTSSWFDTGMEAQRRSQEPSKLADAAQAVISRVTRYAVQLYFVVSVVIAARVFLEVLMVIFNIANSLTRLEQEVSVISKGRD